MSAPHEVHHALQRARILHRHQAVSLQHEFRHAHQHGEKVMVQGGRLAAHEFLPHRERRAKAEGGARIDARRGVDVHHPAALHAHHVTPLAEGERQRRAEPAADYLHLRVGVDPVAVALHPAGFGKARHGSRMPRPTQRGDLIVKHVGFIGLGRMGQPMASNLIQAGYQLTVYDVSRQAVAALEAKGARAAASPAEVGSAVDTVLLSLPTPPIVREVTLGANGVAAGSKVKTVIDLSTTGATVAREVAAELAKKGITAVDSPVSGGVSGAVKATLAVMVACQKPLYAELEPMLKHI